MQLARLRKENRKLEHRLASCVDYRACGTYLCLTFVSSQVIVAPPPDAVISGARPASTTLVTSLQPAASAARC